MQILGLLHLQVLVQDGSNLAQTSVFLINFSNESDAQQEFETSGRNTSVNILRTWHCDVKMVQAMSIMIHQLYFSLGTDQMVKLNISSCGTVIPLMCQEEGKRESNVVRLGGWGQGWKNKEELKIRIGDGMQEIDCRWAEGMEPLLNLTQKPLQCQASLARSNGKSKSRTKALLMEEATVMPLCLFS